MSLFPDWRKLLRTARQHRDLAILDRRHVYILPTRSGLLFGVLFGSMLLGSINYSLSLGFMLAFWLAGLGVVAMLHTWRNLAHLVASPGKILPVFAGENARFVFLVRDTRHRARLAIGLQRGTENPVTHDIAADGTSIFTLSLPTQKRGWFRPGRVSLFTRFPLGLFHAWGYVELDSAGLVYPRPAPPGQPLPPTGTDSQQQGRHARGGDEDFSGLRNYRTGDSMRRVDWKASAREQGLYTKEFDGQGQQVLWLDWDTTPGRDVETRISRLTRWILDAHEAGLTYGMKLPSTSIAPAGGESHLHACLQALALL